MSVALLANENFPAPAIRKLWAAGVDVVAVSETLPYGLVIGFNSNLLLR